MMSKQAWEDAFLAYLILQFYTPPDNGNFEGKDRGLHTTQVVAAFSKGIAEGNLDSLTDRLNSIRSTPHDVEVLKHAYGYLSRLWPKSLHPEDGNPQG